MSYYQVASDAYRTGVLKVDPRAAVAGDLPASTLH